MQMQLQQVLLLGKLVEWFCRTRLRSIEVRLQLRERLGAGGRRKRLRVVGKLGVVLEIQILAVGSGLDMTMAWGDILLWGSNVILKLVLMLVLVLVRMQMLVLMLEGTSALSGIELGMVVLVF